MPVSNQPIFPQTITNSVQQILPADTTTLKTLYTGAVNGSRIDNINICSTDTTARDLVFYITISAVDYLIGTMSCPINSGNTNAIFPVSALSNVVFQGFNFDPSGNRYIYLASGSVLKVKSAVAVTAAKAIQFFVQAGDY